MQGGLAINAVSTTEIISAVDAPVLASVTQVETGSKVYGFFVTLEAYSTSSSGLGNIYVAFMKSPGGNIGSPTINNLGDDDAKRQVFFQKMRMMEKSTAGNPRTIVDGFIKIPKPFWTFRINDVIRMLILVPTGGNTADFCAQIIYKEFR